MFDFTTIPDRKGKDALAVDMIPIKGARIKEGYSFIPMWVADMNFAVPSTITDAIRQRLDHPLFGYFEPREEYYEKIIAWHEKHNQVIGMKKEHIGYENGVLGGVTSALKVLNTPGSTVLIHSPVYIGFRHVLDEGGYRAIYSPLKKDENGVWRMDLADMEEKIVKHHIHTAIISSPHNPTGRVWTREELTAMMDLYQKYDVTLISDEIWSDLILPGHQHIPTQSISEDAKMRTVALYAPSKTFNLAGLIGSYHVIYDRTLKDKIEYAGEQTFYNSMNILSMYGLLGAYTEEGEQWLSELLEVIDRNIDYAYHHIQTDYKGVEVSRPEGTYMMYLDCEGFCKEKGMTIDQLLKAGVEMGVIWQDGRDFLGDYCIRLNLALPHTLVTEAFERLDHIFA